MLVSLKFYFFNSIIWRYLLFSNNNRLSYLSHMYNWICRFYTSVIQITKSLEGPVTKYRLGYFLMKLTIYNYYIALKAIRWINGIRVAGRRGISYILSILFWSIPHQFDQFQLYQFHFYLLLFTTSRYSEYLLGIPSQSSLYSK